MRAPSQLADVGADVGGEQGGHVVGQVDPLELGLLLEDGGPGLELGDVDLHPHAPLEAGAEPLLQPLQLLGAAIAGEDDLHVLLVEGVEGVEELLGGLVLAGEELDVVDEQRAALAVLAAELVERALAQGVDEVVGVALGGDDGDRGRPGWPPGWRCRWRGAGGSCRGRSRRGGRAGSRRGPGFWATAWAAAKAKRFDSPTTKVSKM